MLLNNECSEIGLSVSVVHLARDPSDHAPLLVTAKFKVEDKPRPFRSINAWVENSGFLRLVKELWHQNCEASPIQKVCIKLNRLK